MRARHLPLLLLAPLGSLTLTACGADPSSVGARLLFPDAGPWVDAGPADAGAPDAGPRVPGPPRNVRAHLDDRLLVVVTWDPPADPGSGPVLGYRVEDSGSESAGLLRATTFRPGGWERTDHPTVRVAAENPAGRSRYVLAEGPLNPGPVGPPGPGYPLPPDAGAAGQVVVAELDGDGRPDVLVLAQAGLVFFPGLGEGRLGEGAFTPERVLGGELALSDLNGDGRLDVLTPSGVALNLGGGRFGPALHFPYTLAAPLHAADLDGDGCQDLVVPQSGGFVWLRFDCQGYFDQRTVTVHGGLAFNRAAAGDFDGDGRADVALATSTLFELHRGLGDGGFGPALPDPCPTRLPDPWVVADLNGDGRDDLVDPRARQACQSAADGGFIRITVDPGILTESANFTGDGGWTWEHFPGESSVCRIEPGRLCFTYRGSPGSFAFGDLDGDGLDDLLSVGSAPAPGGLLFVRPGRRVAP